ncbi:hypothetical protein CD32_00955 [Lysinibacillus odysseyi 34hs-1 = NBRC 100172]|uniref:LXG domain-containing protein n=1 Tax=Lysinibacillus odysseyi 34hs-1 = NBRC 100172 TaxID=1220589 RepID=A0A0A3JPF3_9BACI|nr:hypothetical protein CD32_00955 [Lysinibacillus odysseyi 34hs-1 = NBRC 100172]
MDEVADIVGLPKLDDTLVHESIADAKTKRDDTVEALHTFDSTQTAQLLPIETSIQSMKEWVKNIEGLFQAGLTDVDFPADTWFAMASRSSLGMAIAAQQAPVGSVAHALHEQNQLTLMLQASLSNMAPIRFGFGGFAQKSYPTYGPVMLGLGNLSPGNQTSETVQQVSKSSDPDLEEIYAALAKQAEGMDVSSPSSPGTYSAKEEITYEGMRKVLGGNGSGTPDGLALYAKSVGPSAKYVFDFFTEDIRTILDPEATAVEKAMAIGFTFFKPAKLLDKAGDVAGAARDAGKAVDKGTDKGTIPKGFEKQAKSANDISKKAAEGKIKYARNYHGRLGKEKELEILSNPDSVYIAGNNSQNLIYMKGGNVVIVESRGSSKGNTITSYGLDGARGESGAAIFGGKPTDPGMPVTHDAIVNGTIPTPSGGTMPPATQILP